MSHIIQGGNLIAFLTRGIFYLADATDAPVKSEVLTQTPASILAAYVMETLGYMTSPSELGDWPLFISAMPDGMDVENDCGSIYDTSGVNDNRLMNGQIITHHGIQIKMRSIDYETGWEKLEDIVTSLDAVHNAMIEVGVEEYQIYNVSRTTPIIPIGLEKGTKKRYLFTVNFLVTMKKL